MMKVFSRRAFVQSASTIGGTMTLSSALPIRAFAAQADTDEVAKARRVDVHHHILPPEYVSAVGDAAIGAPNLRPTGPTWTAAASLAMMDQFGIETALTSISSPGIPLEDPKAVQRLARVCNDFAKQLSVDHPRRFGMFAFLPLPDVAASIDEVKRAYDSLSTDGIALHTNYRALYLGDPHFDPLMAELNRRKAVVFVHPTVCSCTQNAIPGVPTAAIEYTHDTTRTITSMLFNGTFIKHPDIRFIFSHAGGTIPFLVNRIASLPGSGPQGPLAALKRLYYDVAQSANPQAMGPLLGMVDVSQILFGTDFPFIQEKGVTTVVDGVANLPLDVERISMIERDNAVNLFPRLGA